MKKNLVLQYLLVLDFSAEEMKDLRNLKTQKEILHVDVHMCVSVSVYCQVCK